jgi:GMP synthase (glutamine-hydrolysing)
MIMAKIIVLQHSPYEPLGMIISTLKQRKIRIRYVNFHRHPDERPKLKGYHGLIVLGGIMNPDEIPYYPHLQYEIELIKEALEKNIPVLGICLGSQLLNMALGGQCYSLKTPEYGWKKIIKTEEHASFKHFPENCQVFQWHQFAIELAPKAKLILENETCPQGFIYQDRAIGLQFHLEIDKPLISRWLEHPDYLSHLESKLQANEIAEIKQVTKTQLPASMQIGELFFNQFARLFQKEHYAFSSKHAGRHFPD